MQLTPHFSLSEFTDSDTATRLGIDNTPGRDEIVNLRRNAGVMEAIRAALNEDAPKDVGDVYVTVTSGHRCEALEKVLCDKDYRGWCAKRGKLRDPNSWAEYFARKAHPQGNGTDFKAPRFGTPYEIVKAISKRPEIMKRIDQIIMEGTWVHVGLSDNPRHQVVTATFDQNGKASYKMGLE